MNSDIKRKLTSGENTNFTVSLPGPYESELRDILIADLFLNDPSNKTRTYCMHLWADFCISS